MALSATLEDDIQELETLLHKLEARDGDMEAAMPEDEDDNDLLDAFMAAQEAEEVMMSDEEEEEEERALDGNVEFSLYTFSYLLKVKGYEISLCLFYNRSK